MGDIKKEVSGECHRSKFTIHPRGTKMYQDMKRNFLLGRYEEGCRLMDEAVSELSIDESRTSETKWVT